MVDLEELNITGRRMWWVNVSLLKSAARDHDLNIAQEPAGNKFNRNILLLES